MEGEDNNLWPADNKYLVIVCNLSANYFRISEVLVCLCFPIFDKFRMAEPLLVKAVYKFKGTNNDEVMWTSE